MHHSKSKPANQRKWVKNKHLWRASLQRGKGQLRRQKRSLRPPSTCLCFYKSLSATSRPQDPRTAREWIRDPFVNKPGESSMSVQQEDQLLEIANDGGLRNRLDIRNTLRVSLSPITPRWDRLVAEKQAQGSHWFSDIVSCIFQLYFRFFSFMPVRENNGYIKPVRGAKKVGDPCFTPCLYLHCSRQMGMCFLLSLSDQGWKILAKT